MFKNFYLTEEPHGLVFAVDLLREHDVVVEIVGRFEHGLRLDPHEPEQRQVVGVILENHVGVYSFIDFS